MNDQGQYVYGGPATGALWGLPVEPSEDHTAEFIRNKLAIDAEMRSGFAVHRPEAFVAMTFGPEVQPTWLTRLRRRLATIGYRLVNGLQDFVYKLNRFVDRLDG